MKTIKRFACGSMMLFTFALAAHADAPVFPPMDAARPAGGAFIDPAALKRIAPGLTKDQVRLAIGSPHFSEGIIAVHDWNYAFNFFTGHETESVTCQYRIDFDADSRVSQTTWKDADCAHFLETSTQ